MDITFGFDPGGAGDFGWAVLECPADGLPRVRVVGDAANAEDAVAAACSWLETGDSLTAAGIDSPMYWTPSGDRQAEIVVRDALRARGAPNVGGTVQHPNSLRGACVVQGPTTGILLRRRFPHVQITEAHPKALLWLLGVATAAHQARDVVPNDLMPFFSCSYSSEHQRDAALAAWAAHSMVSRKAGWLNLVDRELEALFIAGDVGYWLPLAATSVVTEE